jgi:predicted membrane protein
MMNINNDDTMKEHRNGKRLAGLVVVLFGGVLLARQLGLMIPGWVFSWPVFLIALGLFIGAKHRFRRPGWIVLCLVGGIFLADNLIVGFSIGQFAWPVIIIIAGLFMIFRPKRKKWNHEYWEKMMEKKDYADYNTEDHIDSVCIFGGVKKNILSKDFKGGEIVCVFGGAEINLTQAEIKGHVVLEIVNVFGGTKLIVPANWEIKNTEMVAILGGIEDKRMQQVNVTNSVAVLEIRGTAIFGGIEIKSF